MKFCKTCGSPVEDGDRFCTKCLARLDRADAVMDVREYSASKAFGEVFDPDSIFNGIDLSGTQVMGFKLTEKIGSVFFCDYYKAAGVATGTTADQLICHIMLPNEAERTLIRLGGNIREIPADDKVKLLAEDIDKEFRSFQLDMQRAGLDCVYYKTEAFYSSLHNKFHIFVLMKNVKPFVLHLFEKSFTLRNIIDIGIDLSEQLYALKKAGISYGGITDCSIYADDSGHVLLGSRVHEIYSGYVPFSSFAAYARIFRSPQSGDSELYSLGMLLYRMLGKYSHPYINVYKNSISADDIYSAELMRMNMEKPFLPDRARNIVGSTVIKTISHSEQRVTIEELIRILKNAKNSLTAAELNEIIL